MVQARKTQMRRGSDGRVEVSVSAAAAGKRGPASWAADRGARSASQASLTGPCGKSLSRGVASCH